VTVIYSFIVVIFLLISMHFIHLFSILLPVCFNKFSVQCSHMNHNEACRYTAKQQKNVQT